MAEKQESSLVVESSVGIGSSLGGDTRRESQLRKKRARLKNASSQTLVLLYRFLGFLDNMIQRPATKLSLTVLPLQSMASFVSKMELFFTLCTLQRKVCTDSILPCCKRTGECFPNIYHGHIPHCPIPRQWRRLPVPIITLDYFCRN